MVGTTAANLTIIIASVVVFIIAYALVMWATNQKQAIKSFVQSARWIFVGIVVGITAESYQNADFFGSQVLTVTITICLLMGTEALLLKFENELPVTDEDSIGE